MITGIELLLAILAIALGIVLFVAGLRRHASGILGGNGSGEAVVRVNFYALTIIALMFFGLGFLFDALT